MNSKHWIGSMVKNTAFTCAYALLSLAFCTGAFGEGSDRVHTARKDAIYNYQHIVTNVDMGGIATEQYVDTSIRNLRNSIIVTNLWNASMDQYIDGNLDLYKVIPGIAKAWTNDVGYYYVDVNLPAGTLFSQTSTGGGDIPFVWTGTVGSDTWTITAYDTEEGGDTYFYSLEKNGEAAFPGWQQTEKKSDDHVYFGNNGRGTTMYRFDVETITTNKSDSVVTHGTITNDVCSIVTNDVSAAWNTGRFTTGDVAEAVVTNKSVRWNSTDSHWEVYLEGTKDGESVTGWYTGYVYNPDVASPFEVVNTDYNSLTVTVGKANFSANVGRLIYANRERSTQNALGLAYERDIVPTVTGTVTKAYVESLGIEAGISAAAATNIAEAVVAPATNATLAAAKEDAAAKYLEVKREGGLISITNDNLTARKIIVSDTDFAGGPQLSSFDIYGLKLSANQDYGFDFADGNSTSHLTVDSTPVLTANLATNIFPIVTNAYTKAEIESESVTNGGAKAYADANFLKSKYNDSTSWPIIHWTGNRGGGPTLRLGDGTYYFDIQTTTAGTKLVSPYTTHLSISEDGPFDYESKLIPDGSDFTTSNMVNSIVPQFIDHTLPHFSNEVLAVGLGVSSNDVAVIRSMVGAIGDLPVGGGAATLGGLLAALVAAVVWLKTNALRKGMTSGVPDDENVAALFTSDNASLNAAIDAEIAARCASLDPAKSSIKDIINALKGNN